MRKILSAIVIILLFGCVYGQKQPINKVKLALYAYPINTFTKIPITRATIKDAAKFKNKIKSGNEFITELESLLKNQEKVEPTKIKNNVRIYIEVYSGNKIINSIILDKGKYIEYMGNCYKINPEIITLILKLFPPDIKNDYTPMSMKVEEDEE